MKKSFLIISLLFALSCSTEKVPENVLDKDKMAKAMLEIHILEAKVQKLYLPRDSSKLVYYHYEKLLFEDLGIEEDVYNESLIYYIDHSTELSEIYERVVDSLLLKQNTIK